MLKSIMVYFILNAALVLVCSTGMISVDVSTIGSPSFIHVNVSGGEPDEVQDNVILYPSTTDIDDDELAVTTGAAVWKCL